jgi:hypothetical protein
MHALLRSLRWVVVASQPVADAWAPLALPSAVSGVDCVQACIAQKPEVVCYGQPACCVCMSKCHEVMHNHQLLPPELWLRQTAQPPPPTCMYASSRNKSSTSSPAVVLYDRLCRGSTQGRHHYAEGACLSQLSSLRALLLGESNKACELYEVWNQRCTHFG